MTISQAILALVQSDKFSDTENCIPKPEKSKSQVKIPNHGTKNIVKYATILRIGQYQSRNN